VGSLGAAGQSPVPRYLEAQRGETAINMDLRAGCVIGLIGIKSTDKQEYRPTVLRLAPAGHSQVSLNSHVTISAR
jgi:hypothetical protein